VASGEAHPGASFARAGLTVALATDGVLMTCTSLSRELLVAQELGWTHHQVSKLFNRLLFLKMIFFQLLESIRNGFLHSFQPQHIREEMAKRSEMAAKSILGID
jgi:hypothetical protein